VKTDFNNEIFFSHCSVEAFQEKVNRLQSNGYGVALDSIFQNDKGESFVNFTYWSTRQPVARGNAHLPACRRIDMLRKENL